MRKPNTRIKRPARSFRRLTAAAVMAIVILAVGAISVLSRQSDRKSRAVAKTEILNARLASQDVHLDDPNGQAQELTAEESMRLAAGLKDLVNQSTEGLVEVQHADGTVSVNLEDRFQNVTVARVNKDGSITQSCVDNPKSAGAFFGIDPQLIDPTIGSGGPKPIRVSPSRNKN